MLFTLKKQYNAAIAEAFRTHQIARTYQVVVVGDPGERGEWTMAIDDKPAHTSYRRLAQADGMSLLEATLKTGRTHQIRRHLAAAGHPLVGEDEHAAPGLNPKAAPRYTGHGLFLCAIGLSIPEGDHGPEAEVTAHVPRKYKRIGWAADALDQHGFT